MSRELWCRHAGCGRVHESLAGEVPRICPFCERAASWTTVPPPEDPKVEWELTPNDKRFLRSIRVNAEITAPRSEDDGA
jgi:hypothetical protein